MGDFVQYTQRMDVDAGTVATLAAASASGNSPDQGGRGFLGVRLYINVTAIGGTSPTLTVSIQGKDPVTGNYYTILSSAALQAVAETYLEIYPGDSPISNVQQGSNLPNTWRVAYTIGGTSPVVTATIGASLLM